MSQPTRKIVLRRAVESLESRRLMHGDLDLTFNFQPEGSPLVAGTIPDYGIVYSNHTDGHWHGWNVDSRSIMRDRNKSSDQRLDTVAQMQQGGNRTWEVDVPAGQYAVTITSGDSRYLDGEHHIDAEGTRVMYGVQSTKKPFLTATKIVSVSDGRLTISPEATGVNTKINSVRIVAVHPSTVSVLTADPLMYEAGGDRTSFLRFKREGDLSRELTVNLDWSGSASTKDFRGRPTSVTFHTYQDIVQLDLSARDDGLKESLEVAKARLVPSDAYTVGAQSTGSITIRDGAAAKATLGLSVTAANIAEGTDVRGEIRITRSATEGGLLVPVLWSGTAAHSNTVGTDAGADFAAGQLSDVGVSVIGPAPEVLGFADGVAEIRLAFASLDDTLVESLESAVMTLATSSDYNLSSKFGGTINIADNDAPLVKPVVTVTAPDADATESGNTAKFVFSRTGSVADSLMIPLNWGGSAGAGDINRPGAVEFAAGSATATLTLIAVDDHLAEGDESATVTIVGNSAHTVGSPSSASITIHDAVPQVSGNASNINWSTTSSPPIVLCETTSIVVDNQLYLFGGFTANFKPQKVAYKFDGTTWTQLHDTPVAFTQPGCTLVDGKVWIAGGYIGKDTGGQNFGTTDVRIYDPASDSWSTGPSLPAARSTGNLLKVGRKLYFVGGETANRAADTNMLFVYDLDNPSAGWANGPSMPLARNRAAAVVVDSRIFIVGGQTGFDGGLTAHNEIQIFDTLTNAWTAADKKLPDVRTHVMNSAQYYNGRIILVTGENAHDKPQNNVWSIDPSTLVTTALSSFPDARFTTATGIVNGKLYAIGGYRGGIATQGYVGTFV